jgi:hypothetical protein
MGYFDEAPEPRPYVPEWNGNSDRPDGERLTIWYTPPTIPERDAVIAEQARIGLDDALAFQEHITRRQADNIQKIIAITVGPPGSGSAVQDLDRIKGWLHARPDLYIEVAEAIQTAKLSEVDRRFFGWLTTGQGSVKTE